MYKNNHHTKKPGRYCNPLLVLVNVLISTIKLSVWVTTWNQFQYLPLPRIRLVLYHLHTLLRHIRIGHRSGYVFDGKCNPSLPKLSRHQGDRKEREKNRRCKYVVNMIVVDKGLNPIEDRNKKAEDVCGLYGLRLMHRLNIFLSCFGHSGWDKRSTLKV